MNISPRKAWTALGVLTFINLFNYLDRYIISALVEPLKASELKLSDTQAGFLLTGFIVVYVLACPVFGLLGERFSRPRLISGGVAVWSLATALGGRANSFFSLFAARATVGVGEAAYGTIAPVLLADYFPPHLRGRIFAIFFSAIPIGSAFGYVIGGLVAKAYDWRIALYVAGLPGLALALLALSLPDPRPEISRSSLKPLEPTPGLSSYWRLTRNTPWVRTVLGYAFYAFGLGGLAFWMPAFLERVRGLPPEDAVMKFGAIVVVTGFIGTFAGGWLGDFWLKTNKHAYLWLSGLMTLLSVPFLIAALYSPNPAIYWTGIVGAEILLFASTGPINSVIVGQVLPSERTLAMAATNFAMHALGDVPSPPLIGWVSDHSSLEYAVCIVPVAVLLSGATWTYSARMLSRKHPCTG